MKKIILFICLMCSLVFVSYVYAQFSASIDINKDTSVFDKIVSTPDTSKARISAINIDILNQEVSVIYQLGDIIDNEFAVKKDLMYRFSSEDGKTEFVDVLASMKIDLYALIDVLKEKIR